MFNWGYALIGFGIGWLGGSASADNKLRGVQNQGSQSLIGLAILAFLIFSGSHGFEWFLMGLVEVFAGIVVGMYELYKQIK